MNRADVERCCLPEAARLAIALETRATAQREALGAFTEALRKLREGNPNADAREVFPYHDAVLEYAIEQQLGRLGAALPLHVVNGEFTVEDPLWIVLDAWAVLLRLSELDPGECFGRVNAILFELRKLRGKRGTL